MAYLSCSWSFSTCWFSNNIATALSIPTYNYSIHKLCWSIHIPLLNKLILKRSGEVGKRTPVLDTFMIVTLWDDWVMVTETSGKASWSTRFSWSQGPSPEVNSGGEVASVLLIEVHCPAWTQLLGCHGREQWWWPQRWCWRASRVLGNIKCIYVASQQLHM